MKQRWAGWVPKEKATLLFVVTSREILLIRKKRGLGAGKVNAPGGRIEPGETPLEAAVRETREEVGIVPHAPKLRGELSFQFVDGFSLHCSVFVAHAFSGIPMETPEAVPLWTPLDAIPYHQMWADDETWLPSLLAGRTFQGCFHFHDEMMISQHVVLDVEFVTSQHTVEKSLVINY